MEQSALEYLIDQLFPKALSAEQYYHIKKAKQMEKEQIINAFNLGQQEEAKQEFLSKGAQYYNETYGSK